MNSKEIKNLRRLNRPLAASPWLVPEAIKFIECQMRPGMDVLETGAGGSTLWFAGRGTRVVTLEHDGAWATKVEEALTTRHIRNVALVYARRYPLEGIPAAWAREYDLILIDGRGRVKSIETSRHLLRPGGLFVLDNSERRRYRPGVDLLDSLGWLRQDFKAASPKRWTTSVWRKP